MKKVFSFVCACTLVVLATACGGNKTDKAADTAVADTTIVATCDSCTTACDSCNAACDSCTTAKTCADCQGCAEGCDKCADCAKEGCQQCCNK